MATGTARPSSLGLFAWSAESTFADPDTDTTSTRMIVRDDQLDVSGLARPLVDRGGVFQYLEDGQPHVVGPFGADGTFTVTFDLAGHGTTTAGDLTQTNLHALLAHVFGGADATDFGGQAAAAGDADSVNLDGGSEDFTPGGLVRIGALGDGRGNGQAYAVASVTGGPPNTSLELLTGTAVAAADNDVVYAMQHVWPRVDAAGSILTSSGASDNSTLRIKLATANTQWLCRGCAPTGVAVSGMTQGEIPQLAVTFTPATWEPVAETFPGTGSTSEHYAAPCAAGSMFIQDRGTTTHATDVARSFEFAVGFSVLPVYGNTGGTAGQNVCGWRRVNARSSVTFTVEADAATTTPTWWTYHSTDPNSTTLKHLLYTCNPHDGRSVALYLPRARAAASVPTQSPVDGLNYVSVTLEALSIDDTTVASTIQNAPWVLSLG